jgi:citrate lyase subunit beta/citryl-CoA lyase
MRSLLFVPGDQERKLTKAMAAGADALILDLEDSVTNEAKPAARRSVAAFLNAAPPSPPAPRLYVRINSLASAYWADDIDTIMPARPFGIVLPKPASGADVHRLALALIRAEEAAAIAPGVTRVIAIATEVPASLLAMSTYVDASSRLEGLAWGSEDLSAALGARTARDAAGALSSPFRLARDLCLVAAAAAGVAAIDQVYADFRDNEGLAREAEDAARDGFWGKMAVHPDQIATINRAFTPSPAEVAHAAEIVRLFEEHPDEGVLAHGGQMLDRPHLARAERVLSRARLAGLEI